MFKGLYQFLVHARDWLTWPVVSAQRQQYDFLLGALQPQYDFLLRAQWEREIRASKNPLNGFGAKYFSQTDEDGITLEIVKRLRITNGAFAELGVGNGLENNTLILLASGWSGFWIGGEDLAFNHKLNPERFAFFKAWVTLENVAGLMKHGLASIAIKELDVVSIDLDGNDFYIARELLKMGVLPKLFILEYNAKFPPPIKWTIKYDASHSWDFTDYQGASLALLADLLSEFSYTLICCNAATGSNAFFIKNEYLSHFTDVPTNIDDVFIERRNQLCQRWHHPPSPKSVERILLAD
jgi:hypothetical protein